MKSLILIFLVLSMSLQGFAQNIDITGKTYSSNGGSNSVSANDYYKNNQTITPNSGDWKPGFTADSIVTNPPVVINEAHDEKKCRAEFKKAYPQEEQKRYQEACVDWDVRGLMTERNPGNSYNKEKFLQCLNLNRALKNPDRQYMRDCATDYRGRIMISADYSQCIGDITKDFGSPAAFKECLDSGFLYEYKKSDFKKCTDKMAEFKQTSEKTLQKCRTSYDRDRILSKNFNKCHDITKSINLESSFAFSFCSQDSNASNLSKPEFSQCQTAVGKMTTSPYTAIALCSNNELPDIVKQMPQCVEKALKGVYKNYIWYVAFNGNNFIGDKNYFYFLAHDCRNNQKPASTAANPYLKFVKDINIHSAEVLRLEADKKDIATVGGISAVTYDDKSETLYLLSDETNFTKLPPRMYTYQMNSHLELKDSKIISFSFGNEDAPDMDPEGLARLSNGQFIVSSEVGKNQTERANKKIVNLTNLNIFDNKGHYQQSLSLPESFKTKYSEVKSKKSKGSSGLSFWSSQNGSDSNMIQVGNKGSRNNNPPPPEQYEISSKLESGLEFNKSLESLSVTPDDTTLFIANESSLYQDLKLEGKCPPGSPKKSKDEDNKDNNKDDSKSQKGKLPWHDRTIYIGNYSPPAPPCGKVVRIARYGRGDKGKAAFVPHDEFKYELEPEVDNGIVEILALDQLNILTLERSWDNSKQKVTSRIFKVTLNSGALISKDAKEEEIQDLPALSKNLVLDLDQIIPELSPGFKILDNFEGMGFGPTLANGNKSLLMVSDNNFSSKQRTSLLIFEILPELLNSK